VHPGSGRVRQDAISRTAQVDGALDVEIDDRSRRQVILHPPVDAGGRGTREIGERGAGVVRPPQQEVEGRFAAAARAQDEQRVVEVAPHEHRLFDVQRLAVQILRGLSTLPGRLGARRIREGDDVLAADDLRGGRHEARAATRAGERQDQDAEHARGADGH
jgi:hypothetical protein